MSFCQCKTSNNKSYPPDLFQSPFLFPHTIEIIEYMSLSLLVSSQYNDLPRSCIHLSNVRYTVAPMLFFVHQTLSAI
jgi:hypothetical protein